MALYTLEDYVQHCWGETALDAHISSAKCCHLWREWGCVELTSRKRAADVADVFREVAVVQ